VWEQEARYFQTLGDFCAPSDIFIEDITTLVRMWHQQGKEVLLAIDCNQDVYSGKLAQLLTDTTINMRCMMEPALGVKVPNSHCFVVRANINHLWEPRFS
jgi:hypothetical protein